MMLRRPKSSSPWAFSQSVQISSNLIRCFLQGKQSKIAIQAEAFFLYLNLEIHIASLPTQRLHTDKAHTGEGLDSTFCEGIIMNIVFCFVLFKPQERPGLVAYAFNPSTGGREQRQTDLQEFKAKPMDSDLSQKNTLSKCLVWSVLIFRWHKSLALSYGIIL